MSKFFILFFCVFLFLVSCRSTKTSTVHKELKKIETQNLLDSIQYQYGNYSTFSARFLTKITSEKTIESKGSIRIQKDSIIWISLSPLLIEAFRCKITPDSVYIINKLSRTYYAGEYQVFQDFVGFPISFSILQAFFLNELWIYPNHSDSALVNMFNEYEPNYKKNEIVFKQKNKNQSNKKTYSQEYSISTEVLRLLQTKIDDYTKQASLTLNYEKFIDIDSIFFPQNISLKTKQKEIKLSMSIEYSKIEFNENISFPFTINPNFTAWQ
ncbi:MAG: DUF4292 domain-containing protein [Bacteroidales bacterium]|nr:DUF4292 domain-containing protein [Bacteroidales bacterium]NLK82358.1 DUF4292 domain-containing protein [Bacteroidales bacterium]HPY82282.1 DUF4292 domain-containing protein [Bacteroidales bacterium]